MKISELIAHLSALVEADPYRADMRVAFAPEDGDTVPIEGGIVRRHEGLVYLLLAPMPLDKVGGF